MAKTKAVKATTAANKVGKAAAAAGKVGRKGGKAGPKKAFKHIEQYNGVPEDPSDGFDKDTPVTPNGMGATVASDGPDTEEKRKKAVSSDAYSKGHCKTTLNQWSRSGVPETAALGSDLLKTYNSFSGELQARFAKKVLESKSSKDFTWTREFHAELSKQDSEKGGCSEDFYTRPQILGFKGMKLKDFDSVKEALAAADEIIIEQRSNFQGFCKHPDKISAVSPLANQYWFAKSLGTTSTWETSRNRQVSMTTALNSKQMSGIQGDGEGNKLLEDVLGSSGQKVLTGSSASNGIKSEYPLLAEIDKEVESIESPYQKRNTSCIRIHIKQHCILLATPCNSPGRRRRS